MKDRRMKTILAVGGGEHAPPPVIQIPGCRVSSATASQGARLHFPAKSPVDWHGLEKTFSNPFNNARREVGQVLRR